MFEGLGVVLRKDWSVFCGNWEKNLLTPAVSGTRGEFLLLTYSPELPGQIQLQIETSPKLVGTLFIHLSAISFWVANFRHGLP